MLKKLAKLRLLKKYFSTNHIMIPKCSFTVMNTINQFNFILYTTTEGTLIYYNLDYITLP